MTRKKMSPQVLREGQLKKSNSFIFRLISNQRFLAVIGLTFLLIIIIPLARTYSQRYLVEQEIADKKKEIANFESKNREFKEFIVYLGSNQSLERQARLNLNLKKPGEQVIVIEDKNRRSGPEEVKTVSKQKNNFQKWWDYFFN